MMMKELSIFVDESGDFGEYAYHSPYYIISFVLHYQGNSINQDLALLENELRNIGYPNHCIHVGPIIRQEEEYRDVDIETRQKIVKRLMTFFRHVRISWYEVHIEKKTVQDEIAAVGQLSKKLSAFVREHLEYLQSFDKIFIYYDNGQVEVNKILSSVFNIFLENVEFRKVIPAEYRLFQVADLICTLQLTELKLQNHRLSKSDMLFFRDERTLKKNYLKPMHGKKIGDDKDKS